MNLESFFNYPPNEGQVQALQMLCDPSIPSILLTGDAGTGKSEVIKAYVKKERAEKKEVVVSASTGFAASLVGGTTYHKAFGIRPNYKGIVAIPKELDNADVVIIDEVSMITAEMFDLLYQEIFYIRQNRCKQLKLVLVGDFFQLPPVTDKHYVNTHWLFESAVFERNEICCIRLCEKVRSADDAAFSSLLDLAKIGDERCLIPINNGSSNTLFPDATFVCGKKEDAEAICKSKLCALTGNEVSLECLYLDDRNNSISSSKAEHSQLENKLILKRGAVVRFTVNDPDDRFENGTKGIVSKIDEDLIDVYCPDNFRLISVGRVTLPAENIDGIRMSQFPLRLSYAITIHKSQGMTFEKINIIPAGWAPGQLYVALSRAKRISDIYLSEPITSDMLKCDPRVIKFYSRFDQKKTWTD